MSKKSNKGFTIGAPVYLDENNNPTTVVPAEVGNNVHSIGIATSDTDVLLDGNATFSGDVHVLSDVHMGTRREGSEVPDTWKRLYKEAAVTKNLTYAELTHTLTKIKETVDEPYELPHEIINLHNKVKEEFKILPEVVEGLSDKTQKLLELLAETEEMKIECANKKKRKEFKKWEEFSLKLKECL